jgi:chromosome segregation and condensation protein ScpB
LNYETKILLIDLAINQFKKDWNEEKWIRIYHFDEKYNSYTREKRNEYIKDLMEAKAMLTKNA